MTERVLAYDRSITPQDTYYWCGPASTQVVLNSRGQRVDENVLAREIGTTVNGTDYVGQITQVLNRRLGGGWVIRAIPNDPPRRDQVDLLWSDATSSINAGFGVVCNIIAPPSNYPRGTRGSQSPAYAGGTVYHYVPIMGWADDGPGGRHVWVADSGFRPFGYWCSLEQMASLIAGKGYTCKPVAPVAEHPVADVELAKKFPSRSKYRDSDKPIGTFADFVLWTDARSHERRTEGI